MLAGVILMYAGSIPPSGYLICDGSPVSRSTYPDLFAAVGTTYGSGDGSTTFNLPNLSGRVAIGSSSTHLLGTSAGEEEHVLTVSEMPSHNHEIPTHGHANSITVKTPVLSHTITQAVFKYNRPNGTVTCRTANAGGGIARRGTSNATASRTTAVAIAAHASQACAMSGSISDCDAFNSASVGSGAAHNNMQPFVTLNYIISTGE